MKVRELLDQWNDDPDRKFKHVRALVEELDITPRGNGPAKLQSAPQTIYSNTNEVINLPYVQSALQQVFQQGVQFGVAAALQNKTLVKMNDNQALARAAMFLRFGNQGAKR